MIHNNPKKDFIFKDFVVVFVGFDFLHLFWDKIKNWLVDSLFIPWFGTGFLEAPWNFQTSGIQEDRSKPISPETNSAEKNMLIRPY